MRSHESFNTANQENETLSAERAKAIAKERMKLERMVEPTIQSNNKLLEEFPNRSAALSVGEQSIWYKDANGGTKFASKYPDLFRDNKCVPLDQIENKDFLDTFKKLMKSVMVVDATRGKVLDEPGWDDHTYDTFHKMDHYMHSQEISPADRLAANSYIDVLNKSGNALDLFFTRAKKIAISRRIEDMEKAAPESPAFEAPEFPPFKTPESPSLDKPEPVSDFEITPDSEPEPPIEHEKSLDELQAELDSLKKPEIQVNNQLFEELPAGATPLMAGEQSVLYRDASGAIQKRDKYMELLRKDNCPDLHEVNKDFRDAFAKLFQCVINADVSRGKVLEEPKGRDMAFDAVKDFGRYMDSEDISSEDKEKVQKWLDTIGKSGNALEAVLVSTRKTELSREIDDRKKAEEEKKVDDIKEEENRIEIARTKEALNDALVKIKSLQIPCDEIINDMQRIEQFIEYGASSADDVEVMRSRFNHRSEDLAGYVSKIRDKVDEIDYILRTKNELLGNERSEYDQQYNAASAKSNEYNNYLNGVEEKLREMRKRAMRMRGQY